MREGGQGLGGGAPQGCPVVYCLVPADLASVLHDLLRRHFADDPSVRVVVERRGRERRGPAERRASQSEGPATERRRVQSLTGRRVGDRRAALVPLAERPSLPRRARRHAERISFVERIEPASEHATDLDTGRLVVRFQSGDAGAYTELYLRYFDPVYAYVRVAVREHHEAEDMTQQVFMHVLEALPEYELRPGKPFRAWLFRIARNEVLGHLRKHGRLEVEDPNQIDRRRDRDSEELDVRALVWISDQDLMLFIERLPDSQRRTLSLRYMLGLSTEEIGTVLDRSPVAVRKLEHRALRFLEKRLTAIGRGPRRATRRAPTLVRMRRMGVVRARRYAIGIPISSPGGRRARAAP